MIPLRKNFKSIEEWADALSVWLTEQSIDQSAASAQTPPIGAQVKWPNAGYTPKGWLKCNGASYATSRYPQLALVMSAGGATFNVPNVAGEIIRAT